MEFRRENSSRRWDVRPRVFTELELELRARNAQESINFPGICKHIGKNIELPTEYGIKENHATGEKQHSSDELS